MNYIALYDKFDEFMRERFPWLQLMSCEKGNEVIYFNYGVPFIKFNITPTQIIVEELFKKTGSDIVLVNKG